MMSKLPYHPCLERALPGVEQGVPLAVDVRERDRTGSVTVEPPDENRYVDVDDVLCSWGGRRFSGPAENPGKKGAFKD